MTTTNKLVSFLVASLVLVFVLLVIAWVNFKRLSVEHNDTVRDHKREIRNSKRREDSLMLVVTQSQSREAGLKHYVERQSDTLNTERAHANKQRKEYEKLLRTRISRTTSNPELDSAVTRFLTGN